MRLIDADKLKQDHFMGDECETCINDAGRCQNWHVYTKMDFCGWIDDAPTVDAVEVTRCKECKWFEPEDEDGDCWCYCHNDVTWRDCYCPWGERKENGETD